MPIFYKLPQPMIYSSTKLSHQQCTYQILPSINFHSSKPMQANHGTTCHGDFAVDPHLLPFFLLLPVTIDSPVTFSISCLVKTFRACS